MAGELADRSEPRYRPRFLRRPTWWAGLLSVFFLAGCACCVAIWVIYRWPRVNLPVFFFTLRPAILWLGMALPLLAAGFVAVRPRWALTGAGLWLLCVLSNEEVFQLLRPFPERAREKFAFARKAFESFSAVDPNGGRDAEVPLRILSWNVAAGSLDKKGVAREIAVMEPDVALIQEYDWTPSVGIGAELARTMALRSYQRIPGRQGIVCRFPVRELPSPYLPPWRCSVFEVDLGRRGQVIFVNVHLSARQLRAQVLRNWTSDALRAEMDIVQAELEGLRKTVALYMEKAPVVIAGDFNLPHNFVGLDFLRRTHLDAFAAKGFGWGKTVPNRWRGRRVTPILRIDLIWVPKGSRVYYAAAVSTRSSDHEAVVAEVALPALQGSGPSVRPDRHDGILER